MATLLHRRAIPIQRSRTETTAGWWHELVWVPIAGAVGFAVTSIMTWQLEVSRGWFVAVYTPVVFALIAAYVRVNHVDAIAAVRHRWQWGVGAGALLGAVLVVTVRRQDASLRPEGWHLVFDLAWLGVVYGAADALLMNVLPVMAVWRVADRHGWTGRRAGKVGVGLLALAAGVLVTIAVHAGYTEYRSADMVQPAVGNTINSLAFVLSTNPIASLITHITMHTAAVFHGAETTVQLPPHY